MAVPFRKETLSFDEKSLELSITEGEQKRVPVRENLLSVVFVKVMHPHRKDCFYICGEISFSDTESGPFVTLFKRSRDDPDIMNLGNPVFQFLILSDNDFSSFRHLQGGSPIFVNMKLYEIVDDDDDEDNVDDGEDQTDSERKLLEQDTIKSGDDHGKDQTTKLLEQDFKIDDDDGEDQSCKYILIADINFKFDDFYDVNKRSYFSFKGPEETGFFFKVAYANVIGSIPAEVTFTINSEPYLPSKEEGPGSSIGKRKLPPTTIYGIIAAHQRMGDSTRNPPSVQLYYKSESEPGNVSVGSPFHLDRRYVVVPIAFVSFWIGYSLYCAESHNEIAAGAVPFPIPTNDNLFFVTDKNLCHNRKSQDGLVSVSLKFITSVEADPSEPLYTVFFRIVAPSMIND